MIFQRLIWSGLAVALLVGTVQTGVQRWQAAPLILAAEVYEEQKAEVPALADTLTAPAQAQVAAPAQAQVAAPAQAQVAAPAHDHEHDHGQGVAKEWEPAIGAERIGWTWVANVLHAFSMALLVFAVMGVWLYKRGASVSALRLGALVAAAGWLSFHLWPTLGLPAEVPGMEAAPLQARQMWWALAVSCAALACALMGFARGQWRWAAAAVLLAVPFIVGAPHLHGDALVGYSPDAHTALAQLGQQFVWATTWVALSFWVSMGVVSGLVFQRWLRPSLLAVLERADTSAGAPVAAAVQAPQ